MAKSIVVELKESWVLSRQNDEVLPIARLCAFLEDKLGEKVSFADSSFSCVKIVPTSEQVDPQNVIFAIFAFFDATYGIKDSSEVVDITIKEEEQNDESQPSEDDTKTEDGPSNNETSDDDDDDGLDYKFRRFFSDFPDFFDDDDDDNDDDKKEEKKEEPDALNSIKALVGADEFKNLCDEIVSIAPGIIKHNNQPIFISQSYLFSINKGYGLTTILDLFYKLLVQNKLLCPSEIRSPIIETTYKDALDDLHRAYTHRAVHLVAIDLSEAMNSFMQPSFKSFMLSLSQYADACIFVFTLPFVEKEVLKKAKMALNDLVFIREVSFSPLNKKEIEEFAIKEIEKSGFSISPKGLDSFHQRIREEKSDGKFYGLKTIKKVVNELIYKKHLSNAKSKNPSDVISKKDAQQICNVVAMDERSGEELLSQLVASEQLKEKVDEIIAQIMLSQQNDSLNKPCIHMQFIGNPGTGKTTVARIIGKMLREKGVLRIGDFHECAGRDLCGKYIGETAPKTASTCRDAYGSVLFIDEAYSLYRTEDAGRDYGREALDTLIAEMENHRSDLVVIVAGYKDEMNLLMQGNPGLQSRIPYKIEFPNFTREQLCEIFINMVKKNFKYEDELFLVAKEYFDKLNEDFISSKEFSNARFVRNLFERTWAKASLRCQLNGQKNVILTKADFNLAIMDGEFNKVNDTKRRKIGFN